MELTEQEKCKIIIAGQKAIEEEMEQRASAQTRMVLLEKFKYDRILQWVIPYYSIILYETF